MNRAFAAAPFAARPIAAPIDRPARIRRGPAAATVCLALAALLGPAHLAAQAPSGPPTIDSVAIVRHSVFDPDETSFWLLSLVNKLHVTTRPYVVRRELLFEAGQPYDSALVAESARNLRRLGVFRSVTIDTATTARGLVVTVTTDDGWSTRPDFRFKSTGGELDYTLALIEDNLLGTATQASVLYRDTPDRTSTTFGFRQPRLIAGRIGLTARWDDRSDGERIAALLSQPFFTLGSRSSWSLFAEQRDERILRYLDGRRAAVDSVFRDYQVARVDLAQALRASSNGYLRVGVAAQVREDRFAPGPGLPGPVTASSTGAVGGWLEMRRARFLTTTGYNALSREEDVDLSSVLRLGAWLAPSGFGYDRSGFGPELYAQAGTRLPAGFVLAAIGAHGLFTSAGLDSGSVSVAGTAAWLPSPRHLAVVHLAAGAIEAPLPGTEFDLGLGAGPRGFRQHAFTGDRMYFATAEYRYGLAPDFLKVVDVGIAAFADVGGAWYAGSPSRSGWDAGIGLRLGASRAPDVEANRIDLVYRSGNSREPAGWVLVVAKGFAFAGGLRGER